MIKIIKSGKKEFHTTCPCCGCEFTYEIEDLNGTDYVNCPECNALVSHLMREPNPIEIFYKDNVKDNMRSNNPCANCDYTKKLATGQIYVGDSPCTWCQYNPFRITCTSVNTATSTNTGVVVDSSKIVSGGITFNNGKN